MKTEVCFILFVLLPLEALASVTFKPADHELPKIANYNKAIKEKGTVLDEKVEIDKRKQFLKVPAHKSAGEIQVLNDFKMNLTMIRNHVKKVCYLMPLDPNRTPKELKDYMDKVSRIPPFKKNPKMQERGHFSVAKEVRDRTTLSDDLASFCAKYPIIRLHENPEATAGNTATFARQNEKETYKLYKEENGKRKVKNSAAVVVDVPVLAA